MTKKVAAFDIETIANPAMIDIMPEVKPKSNLKDPEKIEIDIAEKMKKQRLGMGLDPMYNMICLAGWCDKNGPQSISLTKADPEEEKKLILSFWEAMAEYDHFVTFNGRPFDLRCILLHGMEHGIMPSINIDKGRYNRGNHTDLRQVLAGSDTFATGKLDFFCKKFLGVGKLEGIDGAMIQSYFDMGLYDDIKMYNEDETEKIFELYKKAEKAGLLE